VRYSKSSLTVVLLAAGLTVAAIAGHLVYRSAQRHRPYGFPVITSSSQRVASLFTGIPPNSRFRYLANAPAPPRGRCAAKSWPQRVESWFSILWPSSVYAQSECAGSYYSLDLWECNSYCNYPVYAWYYVDPDNYDRCDGYEIIPGEACGECESDAESGCNSCGGGGGGGGGE
jgi:hypothetical protein